MIGTSIGYVLFPTLSKKEKFDFKILIYFTILLILFISFLFIVFGSSINNIAFNGKFDEYRSPSLETYGQNTYFSDSLNARKPVEGTIARNYLSTFYYDGSLEGYLEAWS